MASVLVKEVCKKINLKSENVFSRKVETALFMLGDDIRKLKGINEEKVIILNRLNTNN